MYINEKSLYDMVPSFEEGSVTSEKVQKTLRGDERHITNCYECKKKFNRYLPAAPRWPYQEHIKGRERLFCSWKCLCASRKKRGTY